MSRRKKYSASRLIGGLLILIAHSVFYIASFIWSIFKAPEKEKRLRALQISDIDNMDGIRFEHYVAELLTYQGYHTQVTSRSGDYGVDIIATKQQKKYAIQVKRWSKNVDRNAVSDAVAGKVHYGCNEAMVITNRYFTSGGKIHAQKTFCRLVDRDELIDWIVAFQNRNQVINADNSLEEQFKKLELDEEIEKLKRKVRNFFH